MAPAVIPRQLPLLVDSAGVSWWFDRKTTAWCVKNDTDSRKLQYVAAWVTVDSSGNKTHAATLRGKLLLTTDTESALRERLLCYRDQAK